MSENLLPKTPAINAWLQDTTRQLAVAGIASAKLDAEIILAHTLRKSRTFLHAHGDQQLTIRHKEIADARLQLRLDRTPLAYIVGHKEFYGRSFRVTPATLIPRPESEEIITLLKEAVPKNQPLPISASPKLVDVGTGSGCLGISAKLELPELDVTLLDTSRHALNVAQANAKELSAEATTAHSNLLSHYPFTANFIIANLPYVDPTWQRSPETDHEPAIALFADNHGLGLIFKLIEQTPDHLVSGGYLFLEADPRQHEAIVENAKAHGLHHNKTSGFILVFVKD